MNAINNLEKSFAVLLDKIGNQAQQDSSASDDGSSFDCYPLSETEKEDDELPIAVNDVTDFETRKRLIMHHLGNNKIIIS